jgi:hypothetical protein
MPGANPKEIVIFVHGIRSSGEAWQPLVGLLKQDKEVTSRFEFHCFAYETKAVELRPHRRISTIEEVALHLREFIARFHDREITLVGHSQGGLVIQAYLHAMLTGGCSENLNAIRQVIMMATPNHGSTFLNPIRKGFRKLFSNPQDRALGVFDSDTNKTFNYVMKHVVLAKKRGAHEWPIPFCVFFGANDSVVPPVSACGGFHETNVKSLEADHFTIIKPENRQDERYRQFVDALFDPAGHACIYEIDLYETKVSMKPVLGSQDFSFPYCGHKRVVHSDNIGCIDRAVTFSRKNICDELFTIQYRTRHDGYLEVTTDPPENEASEAEIGEYGDYGVRTVFKFTPTPGKKFRSIIKVYGGFGDGKRDVHFHIGRNSYSKERVYDLDLSAYLAAGYKVSQEPKLHFHGNDPGCDDNLCKARELGEEVEPTQIEAGIWRWELLRVREGVVDMTWEDVIKI